MSSSLDERACDVWCGAPPWGHMSNKRQFVEDLKLSYSLYLLPLFGSIMCVTHFLLSEGHVFPPESTQQHTEICSKLNFCSSPLIWNRFGMTHTLLCTTLGLVCAAASPLKLSLLSWTVAAEAASCSRCSCLLHVDALRAETEPLHCSHCH
jgi:hypothetical protein